MARQRKVSRKNRNDTNSDVPESEKTPFQGHLAHVHAEAGG